MFLEIYAGYVVQNHIFHRHSQIRKSDTDNKNAFTLFCNMTYLTEKTKFFPRTWRSIVNIDKTNKDQTGPKAAWPNRLYAYYTLSYLVVFYEIRKIFKMAPAIWWVMALLWGTASYSILHHFIDRGREINPTFIWYMCSLIWFMFGFAGIFSSLIKRTTHLIPNKLFIAVFPPLLLHFLFFSI